MILMQNGEQILETKLRMLVPTVYRDGDTEIRGLLVGIDLGKRNIALLEAYDNWPTILPLEPIQ